MMNEMGTVNLPGTKSVGTACVQPARDEKDRMDAWTESEAFI